ncbi:hypothetical protein AP219_26210, partial [Escherichia coli]
MAVGLALLSAPPMNHPVFGEGIIALWVHVSPIVPGDLHLRGLRKRAAEENREGARGALNFHNPPGGGGVCLLFIPAA